MTGTGSATWVVKEKGYEKMCNVACIAAAKEYRVTNSSSDIREDVASLHCMCKYLGDDKIFEHSNPTLMF